MARKRAIYFVFLPARRTPVPVTAEIRSKTGKMKNVTLTPSKAIHLFCMECCGWDKECVKDCRDPFCPLYPFSLNEGVRKGSRFDDDELERRRERMRHVWETKSTKKKDSSAKKGPEKHQEELCEFESEIVSMTSVR
jgi:hypothetical protein